MIGVKFKFIGIFIDNEFISGTVIKIVNKVRENKYYYNNIYKCIVNEDKYIKKYKNIDKIVAFSKGKGFSGTIKRYSFASNRSTHGNSKAHNKPGSIGMCQNPGRLLKGKKMAGRLGNNKNTYNNIIILLKYNNIVIIKGSIAGAIKSKLVINDK